MDWIEFSRKMLHDIANPLLAVRLQLWNLKRADSDSLEEAVEEVEKEIGYLEVLIQNSREVLKMEAPSDKPDPLTAEGVRKAFAEGTEGQDDLDVQYESADWEDTPIPVSALKLIIKELATNAREAGARTLVFKKENERIACTDDGGPFSDRAVEEALTPFFSDKERRNGLGLVKARRALEIFGGRLELESTGEPKKARLLITLPS